MSKLDLSSLARLSSGLRSLPKVLAQEIATRAAPVISDLAKTSFDAGVDPYGVAWQPSVDGNAVKLRKTGALEKFIRYVAIGTKLRVSLGAPYAKWQIGKRPVYPRQGGVLPRDYSKALERITQDTAKEYLARGVS